MYTLNIIGAGKVGSTLGYLLASNGYRIKGVVNRSLLSSQQAIDFMTAGTALRSLEELEPADLLLITTSDDQIPFVVDKLKTSALAKYEPTIFHCSGALTSSLLEPLQACGAKVASLHPIKSFHNPKKNILDFAGTFCTLEGDPNACLLLKEIFSHLGALIIPITTANKNFYHIAMVLSCNYFLTLMDTSLQLLQKAGIPQTEAIKILQPLVEGSWTHLLDSNAQESLTGPIARGDSQLVKSQLALLQIYDPDCANVYQSLGKLTLKLVQEKKELPIESLKKLEDALMSVCNNSPV